MESASLIVFFSCEAALKGSVLYGVKLEEHLYDVQVFALDAAEGSVSERLFGAADERRGARGLGQRAAVTGRVHHHGLDLRLHHGDLQDVGGLLWRWSTGAGLRLELDGRLGAAGHRGTLMSAERDLGDGRSLRDDRLLQLRHTESRH